MVACIGFPIDFFRSTARYYHRQNSPPPPLATAKYTGVLRLNQSPAYSERRQATATHRCLDGCREAFSLSITLRMRVPVGAHYGGKDNALMIVFFLFFNFSI